MLQNKDFLTLDSPKVHFVAGKGGVGKSIFSKSLALFFANQGFLTLHMELGEDFLGLENIGISKITKVSKNLFHSKIQPQEVIFEYLTLRIKNQKILHAFLKNKIFARACGLMPGLFDLTRLGKIWFHAAEKNRDKTTVFDKIIVDMPSSGFVCRFLSIAKVVADAVKYGPLAKEAKEIAEFMESSNNACIHIVTLPQELPINEAIELYDELKAKVAISIGCLVVNKVFLEIMEKKEFLPDLEVEKIYRYFKSRQVNEANQLNRLKKKISLEPLLIKDFIGEHNEDELILKMEKVLDALKK